MALGVDGVRIGTWTAPSGSSGCTVVLPPPGTVGALAVRGSAPGTREAAALAAAGKVTVCHGVVLAGGSAFGLAAADGVVRWLEAAGVGYPIGDPNDPFARVPIVGAAIVLDAAVRDPSSRPDADAGEGGRAAATL
jgi:L-aminopeptidase/D-esterase-like protein